MQTLSLQTLLIFSAAFLCGGCGGGGSGDSAPAQVTPPVVTPPPVTGQVFGLDQRPTNTTCVAPARPTGGVSVGTQRVFPKLTFSHPVAMMQAPGNSARWFVVQQSGTVRVFANDAAVATATNFIDITARVRFDNGELGLLGMAFHPQFPTNPHVYLSYTTGTPAVSRISEFSTTDGGATLDPASEHVLLTVNQPEDNHKGGNIIFGPDGFLYIGFGDGGGAGDAHNAIGNGQDTHTLLGKMLRIDVDGTHGSFAYAIPPTNPFATRNSCGAGGNSSTDSCAEIYAYGFRNPWRWSFDKQTNVLWVGDVGQDHWEEVDRVTVGGNYGWRCREGAHAFNATCGTSQNLIDPVAEYDHTVGIAVTGGYVYRGSQIPALVGQYVFADYGSGRLWHIASDAQPTVEVSAGFDTGLNISSFGQGNDGELYLLNFANGGLYQLVQSGTVADTISTLLSQTGCVDPANAKQPAGGMIPYAPSAAFWSDGADKDRWLALPDGQTIAVGASNDWTFPNGTVLMKNFRIGSQLIETRLFMRHPDGVWAGYSYEWNDAQTDATRVIGGKTKTVGMQTWIFPSEPQCLQCHTAAAGYSLGLETAQLNHDFTYSATSRTANEVATLNHIALFSPAITQASSVLPSLPDPDGTAGTLDQRARAYLHTNCSQCHQPNGGTPVNLDLRYTTALSATNACGAVPQTTTLGIANANIIAPGAAARSVLVARMNRRDTNQMPPIASAKVDDAGVTLITSWINSLAGCM